MKKYAPIILLFLITFIAGLWAATKNYAEFSPHEAYLYTTYLSIVLIAELIAVGGLMILRKYSEKFMTAARALAGLCAALNFYSILLIHNGRITGLDDYLFYPFMAGLCVVSIAIFLIRHTEFLKFSYVFLIIFITLIGARFAIEYMPSVKTVFVDIPPRFQEVTFKDKPNIYVLTFDTLVPDYTRRNILDLDEPLAYEKVIKKFGGRSIKNAFAEKIPTKHSLGVFLAMDVEYYNNTRTKGWFLRNEVPNPVYEILRKNGYKRQFLYKTSYFGTVKNLDYYGFAEVNGLCEHIQSEYAFAGFCLPAIQKKMDHFSKRKSQDYMEFLMQRIDHAAHSKEPWFTFAHIYKPGHAKMNFNLSKEKDWTEFRNSFPPRSQKAAIDMETLLTHLKKTDPNAIVLIFGDHGPLTSYAIGDMPDYIPPEAPEGSPLDLDDIIRDKHAIRAAIFSNRYCKDRFTQEPYSTSRLMRDVMICLSHGQDPLPADYQPDDSQWTPYMYE